MQIRKTVPLSTDGIDAFLSLLNEYGKDIDEQVELYMELLLEMGKEVCENHATPNGDQDMDIPDFRFEIDRQGDNVIGKLIGEGSDIIFIEFGSGITYNGVSQGNSPHPKGVEMGYTIGDYPGWYKDLHGHSRGTNPEGWEYNGFTHYGIQAGMPMWNAVLEIEARSTEIAQRVFG